VTHFEPWMRRVVFFPLLLAKSDGKYTSNILRSPSMVMIVPSFEMESPCYFQMNKFFFVSKISDDVT